MKPKKRGHRSHTTFKKGQRFPGQGGRRENAGRPTNVELQRRTEERARSEEFKKTCDDYTKTRMLEHIDPVIDTYIHHAKGKKSPATTRHFIDHILPPMSKVEGKQSVTFVTNLPIEEI